MVQAFKSLDSSSKMLRVTKFALKKKNQAHNSVLNVKKFVPMIKIRIEIAIPHIISTRLSVVSLK